MSVSETASAPLPETRQGAAMLRVSSDKVNRVMAQVAELSLGLAELEHAAGPRLEEIEGVEMAMHRLRKILREVQDSALELRLVEVAETFRRLRRMVRELERATGKKIELALDGEQTAIDKVVADRLYEPLVHVLRNAADHGLERPDERKAAGKPETGRIELSARQVGQDVQIRVRDDGRGLNRDKILARARQRGLIPEGETPSDDQLWKVIFEPGFSTAEAVTEVSGRGVGMDVLNATMRELRGRISVTSRPGRGADVVLSIPVSLAFLDCMIMRLGARLYAAPIDTIQEVFRPRNEAVQHISAADGAEVLTVRDKLIPVRRLETLFDEAGPVGALERSVVVVLGTARGPVGLPVDELLDQQQVVMKPLTGPLRSMRGTLGCALLGTGDIAMILDPERLHEGEQR
ncbi:two-component system chemotaxis sensor kinase CheA [Rhodovulum bhavnagarense]|uniref:Chemotaxis protein CheA n=1 Tax=Rhodovulum bhavnagarense TaxID=992286 RepID=A0A4R2RFF4_9RHOB|nr:chemotaxis protein CheW [Rhodovulum bhavnagarense]TCP61374.1 two-component system chemotaxis sensor kinase CheA [Rhodovulum bhavnagarense]